MCRRYDRKLRLMQAAIPMLALLFLSGNYGCVSKQYSQFTGIVFHNAVPVTVPDKKYQIGLQFGHCPDNADLGLCGFGLPDGGSVVLLFDRAKVVANDYRLSNQTTRGVCYARADLSKSYDWTHFLKLTEEQRQRGNEVIPLQGSVSVERWNNNIDLRVRLAVSSAGPDSVSINGVIDYHTDQEWHPLEAIALFLSQFGIGGG